MTGAWKGEGFDPDEVLAELDATAYIPMEERLAGLSPEARDAADQIVERNIHAVRAVLHEVKFDEPPCALCLHLSTSEIIEAEERRREVEVVDDLSVGTVTVLMPSGRERAITRLTREVGPWLGLDYPDHFYVDIRTPDLWALEDRIALEWARLHGSPPPPEHDTPADRIDWEVWPWGWILGRVAQALNSEPPFQAVSHDFVAFYQGTEFDPYPHELVPLLASPGALASLRSEGLLIDPPTWPT